MKTIPEIATELGILIERKAAAYGDTVTTSEVALQLLYPQGIAPEHFADVLLIVRIFDKLGRIATDRTAFDESPYLDIAGYAIRGAHHHLTRQHLKDSLPTWHDNVSGPDAQSSSEAVPQSDSAASSTSARTTTSASEHNARRPSRKRESSSPAKTSAPAETAPESAADGAAVRGSDRRRAVDLAVTRWSIRVNTGACAVCSSIRPLVGSYNVKVWTPDDHEHFLTCSEDCARSL